MHILICAAIFPFIWAKWNDTWIETECSAIYGIFHGFSCMQWTANETTAHRYASMCTLASCRKSATHVTHKQVFGIDEEIILIGTDNFLRERWLRTHTRFSRWTSVPKTSYYNYGLKTTRQSYAHRTCVAVCTCPTPCVAHAIPQSASMSWQRQQLPAGSTTKRERVFFMAAIIIIIFAIITVVIIIITQIIIIIIFIMNLIWWQKQKAVNGTNNYKHCRVLAFVCAMQYRLRARCCCSERETKKNPKPNEFLMGVVSYSIYFVEMNLFVIWMRSTALTSLNFNNVSLNWLHT